MSVAPSNGQRVYALIEAEKGGLFRSDDGGENWALINPSHALRQRAWYYSTLTINPRNQEDVWFPQVPMLRTIDGGKTIDYVKGLPHGDNHDLWIDPLDPKRMIAANDGGVHISRNGGATWYTPPLPISQFYHVAADTRRPYWVAGAMQDLGTAQGPSDSLKNSIHMTDWHGVGGGEAGYVVSDASDPNVVFAGEYLGIITRYDDSDRRVTQRQRVAGESLRPWWRRHAVPLSNGPRQSLHHPTIRRRFTMARRSSSARATVARPGKRSVRI